MTETRQRRFEIAAATHARDALISDPGFTKRETLSTILRESTAGLHRETESLPSMRRLLSADLSQTLYRATQARFWGVFKPLESSLHRSAIWSRLDLQPVSSAHLLEQDLTALGVDLRAIAQLPATFSDDWHDELGRAYVLEGSRVGALFIRRSLIQHRWFDPESHGHFFGGSRLQDPHRWPHFKAALDAMEFGETAERRVIAGARSAFQLIHDWMRRT